jgi:hypothetical protein
MGEKYKTWDQAGGKESSKNKNVRLKSDVLFCHDLGSVECSLRDLNTVIIYFKYGLNTFMLCKKRCFTGMFGGGDMVC